MHTDVLHGTWVRCGLTLTSSDHTSLIYAESLIPAPFPSLKQLNMADSYGDGWNGQTWSWVDSSGTGPTGTLGSGSSGTADLCFPAGLDCMTFSVSSVGSRWRELHLTWHIPPADG